MGTSIEKGEDEEEVTLNRVQIHPYQIKEVPKEKRTTQKNMLVHQVNLERPIGLSMNI
ncbi:hypothetical protein DEO72_LG5g2775 [Vigna unguiculata]|uniref:Uncharacterized protein n=1 Tax=Vigna unguiculata TaxID=3917 RepID=A0A4D6M1J6_VIGUN|nr:hypothetical protein DEO72_LG5g2775 [Vigna unguiculata]